VKQRLTDVEFASSNPLVPRGEITSVTPPKAQAKVQPDGQMDMFPDFTSQCDIGFSTLETSDVLENFDFDSFLNSENPEDALNANETFGERSPEWVYAHQESNSISVSPSNQSKPIPPVTPENSDYQRDLIFLEQQNKKRLLMSRQEQEPVQPGGIVIQPNTGPQDYKQQFLLLEQQRNKRFMMADEALKNNDLQDYALQLMLLEQLDKKIHMMKQDYAFQLMLLEQQNQKRLMMAQEEPKKRALQDYQMQLMLLEQQNKKRFLTSLQEESQNNALQDYKLQLLLLEQQNKKRLMMARQEQDSICNAGTNFGIATETSIPEECERQPKLVEQLNKKQLMMMSQEQDNHSAQNANLDAINSHHSREAFQMQPRELERCKSHILSPSQESNKPIEAGRTNNGVQDHQAQLEKTRKAAPMMTPGLDEIVLGDPLLYQFQIQLHDIERRESLEMEQRVKDNVPMPQISLRQWSTGNNALQDYHLQLMLAEHHDVMQRLRHAKEQERLQLHSLDIQSLSSADSSSSSSDGESDILDDQQQKEFESRQSSFQI
jgi:hypothetical protein